MGEVAVILRVSTDTVYEAIRTRRLYAIKLGRRLVVPRRVVEALLAGGE